MKKLILGLVISFFSLSVFADFMSMKVDENVEAEVSILSSSQVKLKFTEMGESSLSKLVDVMAENPQVEKSIKLNSMSLSSITKDGSIEISCTKSMASNLSVCSMLLDTKNLVMVNHELSKDYTRLHFNGSAQENAYMPKPNQIVQLHAKMGEKVVSLFIDHYQFFVEVE